MTVMAPGKAARTTALSVSRACYPGSASPGAPIWGVQPRYGAAERPFGGSWARLGPG